jgi:hypothetical protein
MAAKAQQQVPQRQDPRPTSPAIEPGSYTEYLYHHPEEVDRILRENGVDLEELDRILEQGEGQIPMGWLGEPHGVVRWDRIKTVT